jgi:molybdopterin synthase sulfur carrier subunit
MVSVEIRYWAGAAAASGVEAETVTAGSVADALTSVAAARGPALQRVLRVSSILVDGVRTGPAERGRELLAPVQVEVLPPFAGG